MPSAAATSHNIAPEDDYLVDVNEFARRYGCHRATIYKEIAEGKLPRGEIRGKNRRRWWLSEVLRACEAGPDKNPP